MVYVPRDATADDVLQIVRNWLDLLAREYYAAVGTALGYLRAFDVAPAECIRRQIKSYRSPDYFPGVSDFVVTDWRTAAGGNPSPKQTLTLFEPNDTRLVGAFEIELPLNGKWSDLEADFVWFESDDPTWHLALRLEDISSLSQLQSQVPL